MRVHDTNEADVAATVRAAVRDYLGHDGSVEAVVPAEDVFPGHLAVLADRAIFLKKAFGGVEVRREYLFADADGIEVQESFGGFEVRGKVGDKELRLRQLTAEDAAYLAARFRGAPVGQTAPPLGRADPSPALEPLTLEPPASLSSVPASSPSSPGMSSRVKPPPTVARSIGSKEHRGSPSPTRSSLGTGATHGILIAGVLIVLAAAGGYYAAALDARLATLENERAEVGHLLEELGEAEARIATLEAALSDADTPELGAPAAPPVEAAPGDLSGEAEAPRLAVSLRGSPMRGPAGAWVTMVEFSDFECDHCARVQPVISELRRTYAGDLRLIYKHFPLSDHPHAISAAIASECARDQGRFWRLHDYIFAHLEELESAPIEDLAQHAGGLSLTKWRACMNAGGVSQRIADDKREATALGINGAPAFLINGRLLNGARPLADFESVIDEELQRAKRSGIAKAQYYRKVVLGGGK